MNQSSATKFKAELWTPVSGPGKTREVWAAIMLNGPDKGWPCAFGPKESMEQRKSFIVSTTLSDSYASSSGRSE